MARTERSAAHQNASQRSKSPRARGARGGQLAKGHLLERWTTVRPRLLAAERIALFLDFDGTLAPLCSHPADAEISPPTRRVLGRLARHPRVKLWVVSGRRVADLRQRVRLRGVRCIGLHGWEHGNGKLKRTRTHKFIQRLRRQVAARLAKIEGVWVEDKFISFVVHYPSGDGRRRTLAALRKALARRDGLAQARSKVRVLEGKKVWEILPLEIKGKGAAVRGLLAELKGRVLPIYLGDDMTDESAFESLRGGITVRVGTPRRTKARYELRSPNEVRQFLQKLEAEIS